MIDYLEASHQTNGLEMFRQYRCAYHADTSSKELQDTVAALQHLRAGRTSEAIQLLEQHLNLHASFMCNSYGCLNATNRERVKVDSVWQTLEYYAKYPSPNLGAGMEDGMRTILRLSRAKSTENTDLQKAVDESLHRKEEPKK